MKNLLNLKGLYDSSPNQTGETQSRQNRIVVKPWSSRGQAVLTLLLFFLTLGVGQMWALDIYLDCNSYDWGTSSAIIKLWPGTGSDVTGTHIGERIYKFVVPSATGTMYFKRNDSSGSNNWNQVSVTYVTGKDVYKLTAFGTQNGSGNCEATNMHISTVTGGYIYFDNSVTNWSGTIQFVVGRDAGNSIYTRAHTMHQITGTQFWYVNIDDAGDWNNATYYAFITDDHAWGEYSGAGGSSNISNATHKTGIYTSSFNLSTGSTYVFTPSSASDGSAFTITYKSGGYSAIASTFTHKLNVYTRTQLDGSTPAYGTSLNSPTKVNIKGYQMTENGAATQQTSSVTTSLKSASRGSIISTSTVSSDYTALSANSPWVFDGWAENTSGPSSTSSTYSISNAKTAKTIYAYFSKRTYTVNFNMHGYGDAIDSRTQDYYSVVTQPSEPTTSSAYVFRGWWKEDTYTNQWNFSTDRVTATTTLHAKWLPYVNVSYNKGANGTGENTTDKKVEGENLTLKGAIFSRTGYTQTGWSTTDGGAQTQALSAVYSTQTALTLYPVWTANNYDVTLKANTGTGDDQVVRATYDAAMPTTLKVGGSAVTVHSKTGYTLLGYWDAASSGNQYYSYNAGTSTLSSFRTWDKTANTDLYAHWTPNNYTVTLDIDDANHGSIDGKATSASVTFDAAPTAIAADQLPTAAQGYAFMGFFTAAGGEGVQVINANGTWIASVTGYTDGSGHWILADVATLYAYYKKAQITALTFDAAVVAPGGEVGVTPTVAPTPTGTNSICWKLLYSNGNLYSPQPTFSPTDINNKVTFNAPSTSGTYLIAAVLRTGNDCNGTKLDSVTSSFQVAGDHNVTVQYKCGNTTIAASTTTTGRPLVWSSAIAAPDIFGYTFHHWLAGDGITLSENGSSAKTGERADSSIVSPIYIKAIYDGKLTAVYTQNNIIYFKNTLGWSGDDIHVYFYNSSGYWDASNGAGATGDACIGKGKMDIVPGETDIYYWDYSGITGGAASATNHVAFTNKNEMSQEHFWDCEVVYPTKGNNEGFSSGTPMFVPISQTPVGYNNSGGKQADYYNKGYWTKYTGGTGYSIDIFFSKGGSYDKSINFEEGETAGMPFTATAYLSGGTTLGFKIHRSSGLYYYYNSSTNVTMSNASTAKSLTYDNTSSNKQTGITTNVTGEYTFTLTCGSDGKLNVTVKYPAAAGDYRLVYSDGVQTKPLVSDVVPQVNGGKDTVSFFVRPGSTPLLKIQQASESAGVLSWGDYNTISSSVSGLAATGVYNICLQMDGSGAISVEKVEAYTGEFYIRTDAANNKWDNYRAADHLMTYSEYSETYSDYTHYFMAYVANGKNVKFVVANDYSPCISDTLVQSDFRGGDSDHVNGSGDIQADANVRFMWNRSNNAVYRAYLAKAQSNGSKFLVLRANSDTDLMDENGNALTGVSEGTPGNNHGGGLNCMQFTDNQNWIYEANVKVRPGAFVKLYAHFHGDDFYYRGNKNDTFDGTIINGSPNAIQLITGEGDAVKVRVVYDFKTDRLLAAWMPEGEISDTKTINADVMFVREGQGDILQLTFTESGEITAIKTAYGVMRFNKWTLNNKSKEGGHAVLGDPKSVYERSLFWISFPFKVKLNDIFGFGTYGVDWAIQKYNGARRAAEGFWAESRGFWEWMDRNTEYLEPNQGYLLAIDLDRLGSDASVWNNGVENIELYFPSYGTMPSITSANVEHTLPSHECKIDWSKDKNGNATGLPDTGNASTSYNRTIFDSHWNVMSVPTYVNTSNIEFANTDWIAEEDGIHGPNFLYTWNPDDNTLTPTAGAGYHYHAMHAYMVQYHGDVTWSASSGSPYSSIVARRTYADQPEKLNLCLEIRQNEKMIDRTYVVLSNDEKVSENFQFGEDMTKEFNARKANICTYVEGMTVAGNTLPMSEQTTIVPVGAYIKSAGDYTFAIPEGTNGVDVTLIDNETGVRTSLSALDYTVNLEQGTYDSRFLLEISPVQNTPTGLGNVQGDNVQGTKVRKVMIDGILYIVKDGKMFDARGTLVR